MPCWSADPHLRRPPWKRRTWGSRKTPTRFRPTSPGRPTASSASAWTPTPSSGRVCGRSWRTSTSPAASCLARCPPPAVPPCQSSPPSTRAATGQWLTVFTCPSSGLFSPCPPSWLFLPCPPSWLFFTLSTFLALSPCPPSWLFHPVHLPGSFTLSTFLALSPCPSSWLFHPVHLPGSFTLSTFLAFSPCLPSWLFSLHPPSWLFHLSTFLAFFLSLTSSTFLVLSPVHLPGSFHSIHLPGSFTCPPSWLCHPVTLSTFMAFFPLSTFLAFFISSTFLALSPVHLPGFFHPAHLPGSLPWAPSWLFATVCRISMLFSHPFCGVLQCQHLDFSLLLCVALWARFFYIFFYLAFWPGLK